MAAWESQFWESSLGSGLSKRDRRSGGYVSYVPDRLVGAPLQLPPYLDSLAGEAERAVQRLSRDASHDLAGISRFLLRSEAIASSQIEGIAPSAGQVALAELSDHEAVADVSVQARLVANNMTVVREARARLAEASAVTVEHVVDLHRSLLPEDTNQHGLRTVQNWIGGSQYHPIDADFVPPTAELAPGLVADLVGYMNGAAHSPIVQAALVHAQFETIHPFTDGNGRVGRALIHTVLTRRGLTEHSVLPVSLVFATLREKYVDGLTAYRHAGAAGSEEFHAARAQWIEVFTDTVLTATNQAAQLATDLVSLREEWEQQLKDARDRKGRTRAVRSDSATALILRDLPSTPVLTSATVQRIHGVSHVAAGRALEELTDAGVLSVAQRAGRPYYRAQELLDLVTSTERRLASTRFDTRVSPPIRPVPAAPR